MKVTINADVTQLAVTGETCNEIFGKLVLYGHMNNHDEIVIDHDYGGNTNTDLIVGFYKEPEAGENAKLVLVMGCIYDNRTSKYSTHT